MPGRIIDVDDVNRGNAQAHKRHVIVVFADLPIREVGFVSQLGGDIPHQFAQSRVAVGLLGNVEVLVADHIHVDQALEPPQRAVFHPAVRQVAAAVEAVGIGPLAKRFFAVEERQVEVIHAWLMREDPSQLEQQTGGGAAVARAHEFAAREKLGVEVAGDGDGPPALAWKLGDDVPHGHHSARRFRGKGVLDDLAPGVLQLRKDIILQGEIRSRTRRPRAELDRAASELERRGSRDLGGASRHN